MFPNKIKPNEITQSDAMIIQKPEHCDLVVPAVFYTYDTKLILSAVYLLRQTLADACNEFKSKQFFEY